MEAEAAKLEVAAPSTGPVLFKTPTKKEAAKDDIAMRIREGVLKIEKEKSQKREEKIKNEADLVTEGLATAKKLGVRY